MNALKQLFNILNRRDRGICIDVKSWAMRNGFFVEVLRPSEQVTQRLPDKFPAGHSQFKKRHFFETNERFVAKIPKAQVVGPGFVILPDGRFAFDYQTHETRFITQHPTYFQRWRRNLQKTSLQGSYFSLLSRFCSEHYHWIHDALLQLHLAHEYLPGHVKYLVPRGRGIAPRWVICNTWLRFAFRPLNSSGKSNPLSLDSYDGTCRFFDQSTW